jgi:hypothetical protein
LRKRAIIETINDLKWTPLSRQKQSEFKLRLHVQQKTCCSVPWGADSSSGGGADTDSEG